MDASEMEKKTGIVVIVLLSVLQFAGCSDSGNDKTSVKSILPDSKKIIKNFTLIETEGDQKKWIMDACWAKLTETDSGEVLEVEDFKVRFYENNKVQSLLKAESGIYNKKTQSIETFGNVEIETEGKKIKTKNVIWDPSAKLFITQEEVLITSEGGILKGRGMEASMDLEEIRLNKEITGEMKE